MLKKVTQHSGLLHVRGAKTRPDWIKKGIQAEDGTIEISTIFKKLE